MSDPARPKHSQTVSEEVANAMTHGLGALLSVFGLVLLVLKSSSTGDPWRVVGFSIFGAAMVGVYLSSTLYHSFAHTRARRLFKTLDHALIYLLIAGTYTPVMLINLRGPWGWSMLAAIWSLAIIGIAFKTWDPDRYSGLSTAFYLAMGWACTVAIKPLLAEVPMVALQWLLAGGLAYTVGTAFYVYRGLKYQHTIWHVFVLAGTACHFTAIYSHI